MDYETARRVRGRSVKELTIQNIANGGSIFGSYKTAIGSKFKEKATRLQEKFDPLNWVNMINSPLTTAIVGRLFGRKSSTIRYYLNKQKRNKNPNYTKVGPGRTTKLRVGDSSADILAKMFNLMQKEHDENLKRWELESEHSQQRKDEEEKQHQELLKAIAGMGHVSTKDNEDAEKKKSKSLKEKLEDLFKDIMKPIEAIGEFFKDVFKFVENIFLNIGKGIIEIGKGLFGILEFFVGLGKDLAEVASIVLMKVIKYIGPILGKLFKAVELIFNKVVKSLAELFVKAISSSGPNKPSYGGATTPEQKKKEAGRKDRVANAVAMSATVVELLKQLNNSEDKRSLMEKLQSFVTSGAIGGALIGGAIGAPFGRAKEGAELGLTIGEIIALWYDYKKNISDPKEKQKDLFYYGPDAVHLMEDKKLTIEDNEVKASIIDYQWNTLIPLMAKEGIKLKIKPDGTYDYDWKNLIPHFEDKDKKVLKEDDESLLELFINGAENLKKKVYEEGFKKAVSEELTKILGVGLNVFSDVPNSMITGAEQFIKDEMGSIKESLPIKGMSDKLTDSKIEFANMLKKVENIISDTDLHNGATIIMPTVTNTTEGPGLKRKEGDGIGLVRTTDTSLRQCQNNYAIAC